jgi:sigma-E factor negative regulatory protein RseA
MSGQVKKADSIDELVSALMDGELEREAARFLMRRLEHEPRLAVHFGNYHTIRACMRREPVLAGSDAFIAGIWSRLDGQAADAAVTSRPRYARWLRAAAGGAIAAGMAAVALISLRAPDHATLAPVAATPAALRPVLRTEQAAGRFTTRELAPEAIEGYLMRHSGAVATVGGGNAPFVYATAMPRDNSDPNVRTVAAPDAGTR